MWGQTIPYPHKSGLVCHVSNKNTYRWCALGIGGIHSVSLNCSGRARDKVGVSGPTTVTTTFDEVLHYILVRIGQQGELSLFFFFTLGTPEYLGW